MSVKKKNIEEKMSESIFYNLSILKQAVKTTPEFDENLNSTMFLKSNTKAFIHITHFLFNIIDSKEFTKKFYWPIVEKKNENSYRSSSVDFINNVIDKYSLSQNKVKLVFVVHPCGKKFMSLILDLIAIAIKEVMKRRKIVPGKSFDIEEVTQACTNMKEVENDLVNSIKTETKVIRERTEAIQELLSEKIYPSTEFPAEFSEFIASWHEENQNKLEGIKERNEKMKVIQEKTRELCARAEEMLAQKTYEVTQEPLDVIKSVSDFYENAIMSTENIPPAIIDEKLNFHWLIAQLHMVLPAITSCIENTSFESSENSVEELKVLKRLSQELATIETNFDKFADRFQKTIPPMVEKLKLAKEERQRLEIENESPDKTAIRAAKEQAELESLKLFSSPRYYFDTSKDCLKNVAVKKNRLALIDDDDGKENLNDSKFYRVPKSPYVNKTLRMNQTISNEMGPPKQQPRRRLDPMALLERATSKKTKVRSDLNSTAFMVPGSRVVAINKFSSTMLSPDFHQPLFNCSTVSEISKNSPATPFSPVVESMFGDDTVKPANKSIPWEDAKKMNSIQKSPKGGLQPLVTAEEIFKAPPKICINDDTVIAATSTTETTLCKDKSLGSDSTSFSCTSMMMKKMESYEDDEDLFNTSDTILQQLKSPE